MKSLFRSIIGSACLIIAAVALVYFKTVKGIIETGSIDFLINGYDRYGKSILLINICFLFALIPICYNFWKKTLLPLAEVFILRNVVEKDVVLTHCRTADSAAYFPIMQVTALRIANEMGDFTYPYAIDEELEKQRVHIRYLPKSMLVLEITKITD